MKNLRNVLATALLAACLASSASAQSTGDAAPKGELQAGEQLVEDIVAWINDDIIVRSEISLNERDLLAQLIERGMEQEELEQRFTQMREQVYLQSIWSRLLLQEAERLYDLDSMKDEMLKTFMQRNQIESLEELEQIAIRELQLDIEGLKDRLVLAEAPRYVVQSQIMGTIGISEADIRKFYEENVENFTTPGSVTFREIVLEDASRQADAQQIAAMARGAEGVVARDFEELVREHSESASRALGGRIGPIDPNDLLGPIRDALLETETGGVTDPVLTANGWHVLKVEDRAVSRTLPFEEVREQCENLIREERFADANEEYVTKLWEDGDVEIRTEYAQFLPKEWRERSKIRD